MRRFFVFVSLAVHFAATASPTYLTGELNRSLSGRDYVVTGNIYVLPHDTLSIAPGSRIRFEPFTGIVVRGAFLCNGTAREPVLLTSVRDSLEGKPPQRFDWNGVEVTPEGVGCAVPEVGSWIGPSVHPQCFRLFFGGRFEAK